MDSYIKIFLEKIKPHRLTIAIAAVGFGGALVLGAILMSRQVIMPYSQYIVGDINQLPEREVALVFGGGMEEDGTQSKMQAMRVKTAVELYKKGKVKKIMMTGDDGRVRFDEITAMVYDARVSGVPVYDIMTDPHGYRTYESCYRESRVYELTSVIAISQEFHLPRILYFCRNFGIDTIGFAADYHGYNINMKMAVREMFARVKGWWQVTVTEPLPRVTVK